MKIKPKQYARGLYDAIEGKSEGGIKDAIQNLVSLIAENNDLKKAGEIIREFDRIYDKEKGIIEARVVSAYELQKGQIDEIEAYIKDLTGSNKVLLKKEVDRKVLGGVIIKYGSRILDASLKTKLEAVREALGK